MDPEETRTPCCSGGVAWALLALLGHGCAAHLPAAGERIAFLERSAVSISSDRSQSWEADPALHLLLWNGLDDAVMEESRAAITASASFLGSFRMMRGDSTPIRTPTYEARARLQLFRAAVLSGADGGGGPRAAHRLLWALALSAGHRSNGQGGCALADHVRLGPGDFDCAPAGPVASDRLNLVDGSFTTNYAGLGLSGLWAAGGAEGVPARVLSAGAEAEWNVPCRLGACMPAAMRARYGAALLRGSIEAELPSIARLSAGRGSAELGVRATLAGSVHLGASGRAPFGDRSVEVALLHRPRGGLTTSLFVRRHRGRDPLNIRFEEPLDAWILGLGLEPGAAAVSPARTSSSGR